MLRIKKLYSEPKTFSDISFTDGINLILGEKTDENDKTNAVGKSLSIEFLNYGLLKRHEDSRVSLIPAENYSYDTLICLDFEIHQHKITTKRSIKNQDSPEIIVDGKSTKYSSLTDAYKQLENLLFGNANSTSIPSFRSMMSPLIRDERSEFKSIIKCFNTEKNIPSDYTPHLYLLDVDPLPYKEARKLHKEIKTLGAAIGKIKDNIVAITGKSFSEAKTDLNELSRQVQEIEDEIESLENVKGYEIVRDEIIDLEHKLEQARSRQATLKAQVSRIKLFSKDPYIDDQEVADLYNQFKDGLGDLIKKEIQEVVKFKSKIDDFQRSLIDSRYKSISKELASLKKQILSLDNKYKEKLSVLNQEGGLKNLRQTIASYQQKSEERAELLAFITKYSEYESEKKEKQRTRDNKIYLLESLLANSRSILKSLENTIFDIHEYVAGNRLCSFDIKISKKVEIVNFDLRIYDDGSHSNEREKVFLYDIALLLNPDIAARHPGLLIHDNIFDVDKDTLIKSLNYLYENENLLEKKQYILTINSDEFTEEDIRQLHFSLDEFRRVSFTKEERFLKVNYQQL